jgi:hypothetical protein
MRPVNSETWVAKESQDSTTNESRRSSCGKSIPEWINELTQHRFIQFHANERVMPASISGSFRKHSLNIAVASCESCERSVSYRPVKGTVQSNFDSTCAYLRHAAEVDGMGPLSRAGGD